MSLRERIKTTARDEAGAVAVMTAVLVLAFVALSAIVVDVGYLYDTRRELQAAAEAGALAGCQELITSGDAGLARTSADQYAHANAVRGPVKALEIRRIDVDTAEKSVRVVVAQQAPMFFSRMLGPATREVQAAAKARAWQLEGGRYLVPWAIPIVRVVDRVEAWTTGGTPVVLTQDTGDPLTYFGYLSAPSAGGTDVFVRVYNEYGIPEILVDTSGPKTSDAPAGRIIAADAAQEFTSITLSDDYFASDAAMSVTIHATTKTPQTQVAISVGGGSDRMTASDASGLNWQYTATLSALDDVFTVIPVTLSAGGSKASFYLHVRRSTLPVRSVRVQPIVQSPGGSARIEVRINDFDPSSAIPGQLYTLRVGPPSNLGGNFAELNYNRITHLPSCPPDLPGTVKSGVNYYDNVVNGYSGGVHVGDIIETSPGGTGTNTRRALDERASKLAPGAPLIVTLPVVEKIEDKYNGSYAVVVKAFAAFKIVGYDGHGDAQGEFIKYIANPSDFATDPEGGVGIYAPRLVNP